MGTEGTDSWVYPDAWPRDYYDRFLIIDDVVYVFGASLKDAGKKLFAYIRMQETSASDLLNNIR